jgi:hypothetical protein
MSNPSSQKPQPNDIALEQALPEHVEQLEQAQRSEEQEQRADPESVQAPDAG